jgi:hypothetical protein
MLGFTEFVIPKICSLYEVMGLDNWFLNVVLHVVMSAGRVRLVIYWGDGLAVGGGAILEDRPMGCWEPLKNP